MSLTKIPVLAYHGLNAPDKHYAANDHVALEEDLKTIRRLGFKVARLSEIAQLTWNRAPSRLDSGQWVGLSFDDGTDFDYLDIEAHPYLGHVKSFYTILTESGSGPNWPQPTGTAFVIASPEARAVLDRTCIVGLDQWRDSWWREAAATSILEIGNHSWDHTHPCLPTVAQREQRKGTFVGIDNLADANVQIARAQEYIRRLTGGLSTPLFAYPYGETTEYLVNEYFPNHMTEHRMLASFSTAGDYATRESERWSIPRFMCGLHWKSPEGLEAILRGARYRHAVTSEGIMLKMAPTSPSLLQRIFRRRPAKPRGADISTRNSVTVSDQAPPADQGAGEDDQYVAVASIDDIIRVEEVSDAEFFIGDLFRRRFHCNPPDYPRSFVAFYQPVRGRLEPVGFVHYLVYEDSYLCGGLVIDERLYRRMPQEHRRVVKAAGGIAEKLLRTTFARLRDAPAIWGYVGDPLAEKVDLRAGFRHTGHQHVMVYWTRELPEEEKEQRIAKVVAFGPF